MSGFNPKSKLAYFKDNVQSPEEQDDYNVQQYYYSRGEGGPGPSAGEGSPFQGYPPPSGGYGPGGGGMQSMAQPMGMLRQQSAPSPNPLDGYPAMPQPQQSRSLSHSASPIRGPSGGPGPSMNPNGLPGPGRDAFNVNVNNLMDASNFPSMNTNPSASSRYGMGGGMGGGMIGGMGFGTPGSMGGGQGPYSMDGSGMGIGQQTNFTMQNEDFPALPGSGPGAPPARQGQGAQGQGQGVGSLQGPQASLPGGFRGSEVGGGAMGGGQGSAVRGNVSAAVVGSSRTSSASSAQTSSEPSSGTQQAGSRAATGGLGGAAGMQLQQLVNGDSEEASGAGGAGAGGRPKDRFGLMGLLDVIKMTDRDLNTLALGTDLTTFGLNLSSTESLYLTFSSPFSDAPAAPEVPFFSTPSSYLMQPPSLKSDHLNKMHIETLFYMFYSMPRDQLQTAAAVQLYRREWWFHADLRLWMKMRAPPAPAADAAPAASPHFVFFDVSTWEARIYSGNALRMSGFLPGEALG
jgi:CCR4-NOT transcription complex subunit 2